MTAALIALIIAIGLDVATTNAVLARGGYEMNPVTATIMRKMGRWWAVGRAIPTLVAGAGLAFIGATLWIWAVVVLTLAVVANNYIVLRRSR